MGQVLGTWHVNVHVACNALGLNPRVLRVLIHPALPSQTTAGGIAHIQLRADYNQSMQIEYIVYFKQILLCAGFLRRISVCYCCQRTEGFHAANTKSFIPENQGCSRNVVLFGICSGQNSNSPNDSLLHFLNTGLFVYATNDKMLFQYWFLVPGSI